MHDGNCGAAHIVQCAQLIEGVVVNLLGICYPSLATILTKMEDQPPVLHLLLIGDNTPTDV